MTTVKLKKIEIAEIEVLQGELLNFLTLKNARLGFLQKTENEYFDTLLTVDILQKLYYNFRGKIEKVSKTLGSLTLTVSESVMLMQVCSESATLQSDYCRHVLQKFLNLLFNELINLN